MRRDRFPVAFDMPGFLATGVDPRARAAGSDRPPSAPAALDRFITRSASQLRRSGSLPHPYLVPGAHYSSLWTWDAYFMAMALPPDCIDAEIGSLRNLLDALGPDGRPPSRIDADGTAHHEHGAQPVHAAWAWSLLRRTGDEALTRLVWHHLETLRLWWDRETLGRRGLYRWIRGSGTGIDNDPAIYGRSGDTVALVDVNCFHVRELQAMALLADRLGRPDADVWRRRARDLVSAINTYMWDDDHGTYLHLDLSPHTWGTFQDVTWEIPLLTQTWANLFPLWTGVADQPRADRLITEHVLSTRRFRSPYGIRSSPADQRFYNNVPMADPSNWQGPVWVLPTALTAYGLARYGHRDQALLLTADLRALLQSDLDATRTIHECYDAETGAPLTFPGFMSWNTLITRLDHDLRAGRDPTTVGS